MRPVSALLREGLALAPLGSTALARDLAEADQRLRRPVSTSRRVAAVGVHSGAGVSTTVVQVAAALAARRGGSVLAVDAATGPGTLAALAGVERPVTLREAASRSVGHGTASRARDLVPTGRGGLHVLGDGGRRWPGPGELEAAVRPVGRAFDLVLTDLGARAGGSGLAATLADQHAVLLVARADRGTAERALAFAATLVGATSSFLSPTRPRIALALVDIGGSAGPSAQLVRRALADAGLTLPVAVVPHDPSLAGHPPTAALPDPALPTRAAVLRLAGNLVALATGGSV